MYTSANNSTSSGSVRRGSNSSGQGMQFTNYGGSNHVPGYARPKSAGATRRNDVPANVHLYSNGSTQNIYQKPADPEPVEQLRFTYTPNANPYNTNTRPLSASATAHSSAKKYSEQAQQHWHYGENNASLHKSAAKGATDHPISGSVSTNPVNNVVHTGPGYSVNSYGPSAQNSRPSSASARLRNAVDLSNKIENMSAVSAAAAAVAEAKATAAEKRAAGVADANAVMANLTMAAPIVTVTSDGDEIALGAGDVEAMNLDRRKQKSSMKPIDDDDEMDGKPIESRSQPEVSTATPSASMELGGNTHSSLIANTIDVRNTSVDSIVDENINIGLSTVPNQFCTKRDAVDLKKLLLLSVGARGGVIPSSSAVMDMYMVGKVVGVGSYGKVRAAWHRLTGAKVAIKTYDKAKMKDPAHWKRVHSEIKITEQISHPRIARMYEAVETPKRMHLIMECLDGGNLCSYVKAKKRLSEDESRRIFFQILQSIEHLHGLSVSHRDIKLENVLFADDRNIKLIDFGFSTVCQPGKKLKVFCGTPSCKYSKGFKFIIDGDLYPSFMLDMAPEIVRRLEYDGKPVDMWSLGILLYALLCGCFPFRAKAYPDLYRRIARGVFTIPEELSPPVKDLLRQLLTVDPTQRITAHAAMRHSWLQVQLINSPNMDKLRLEIPILVSDKPADDLDDDTLNEIAIYGVAKEEMVRIVMTKTHCSTATLYYLLLNIIINRRKSGLRKNSISSHGSAKNSVPGSGQPVISTYSSKFKPTAAVVPNTAMPISSSSGGGGVLRPKSAGAVNTGYAYNTADVVSTAPQYVNDRQTIGSANSLYPVQADRLDDSKKAYSANPDVVTAGDTNPQNEAIHLHVAQRLAMQHQNMMERQEYRLRPKSASMNRNAIAQRPLSAYAGNV